MTPEQILLVRASWPVVAAKSDGLATRFYEYLFEIDPGAARLFAHVDMAAQRVKLSQALTVVVDALDDPDRLLPAIGELGKRHARYGVEHRHFDSVGEALLRSIGDSLGARVRSRRAPGLGGGVCPGGVGDASGARPAGE